MVLPSSFTGELVRSLGGPEWLRARRLAAFARAREAEVPTGSEEIWRYSRVADLHLERFTLAVPSQPDLSGLASGDVSVLGDLFSPVAATGEASSSPVPDRVAAFLGGVGSRSALVVTYGGRVVALEAASHPGLDAGGLEVVELSASTRRPEWTESTEALLGSVAGSFLARWGTAGGADPVPALDLFDHLSDALASDAVVVRVRPGAVVEEPVVVVHLFGPGGVLGPGGALGAELPVEERPGPAYSCRTVLDVGENAEASVMELLVSDDGPMLVLPTVETRVADGARLRHSVVQQLGRATWQIGHVFASAERDATLRLFEASLGGEYARSRIDSVLTGQGGSAQLLAAYLGDGDQMHDFRTLQEHDAPRSTSDLVFKGAVGDRSRSVYSGLIRMRKGAKAANAFQTNRNLVLSDGAHAESVPNLDIEENDVRCSHASAVGPVDEEQRFYLESRGVPRRAAERLIVLGFFRELLERVPEPVARHVVAAVEERVRDMTETMT